MSDQDRRVVRLYASLGSEIDPPEVDDILTFAWDRHIHGRDLDRDRAVREGVWLFLQNLDPLGLAFDPLERATLVQASGTRPDALAETIARVRDEWNRTFPHQTRTFSQLAERVIDCVFHRLDPHSSFFAKPEWENMTRSITGEYSGIGILLSHAEEPIVTEVFEGGPADGKLQRLDRIVAVDGKEVRGMSDEEYLGLIRGEAGTEVRLRIRRSHQTLEVPLKRRKMKARAVRRIEAGTGHDILVFRLWSFIDGSADQVADAIRKAKKPLRGVVLDLRNNGGGTVDDAIAIVDLFIDRGLVITERGRGVKELEAEDDGAALPENVPLIVLVNRFSASASEITAGALRDHGRAVLMGEATYGKGTVQEIYRFGQRGAKVTVARFYLPGGRSTQIRGVTPDIAMEDAEARKVAEEAAAHGERLFEREYDNAVEADAVPGDFRAGYDLSPLLARLKGRLGSGGAADPEVEASDVVLQEAVRILQGEEPVPLE